MDDRTLLKQKIRELLERNGIDMDLSDFGDLVFDIGDLMASETQRTEPYATETIGLLREGGRSIQRNLGYLEDDEA